MFCIPIPSASVKAPATVAPSMFKAAAPKATPIASPSGILCNVIARNNNVVFLSPVEGPSAVSSGADKCKCGVTKSSKRTKNPPARKPMAAGIQAIPPSCSVNSIAGASNDQNDAAIMTPAAKPSIMFMTRFSIVVKTKTSAAPSAVNPHVIIPASNACTTTGREVNQSNMTIPSFRARFKASICMRAYPFSIRTIRVKGISMTSRPRRKRTERSGSSRSTKPTTVT